MTDKASLLISFPYTVYLQCHFLTLHSFYGLETAAESSRETEHLCKLEVNEKESNCYNKPILIAVILIFILLFFFQGY